MRVTKIEKWILFLTIMFVATMCVSLMPNLAQAGGYQLGVGDVLQISVWGHTELNTMVEVRPDGYITFPLVGDRLAVGKTSQELAGEIQRALADYVVEPRVTVIISQFRTVQAQILGEVRNPGNYSVQAGSRLMDMIGLAGGPTTAADLSAVTLTRYSLESGDYAELISVNLNEFISTGALAENPVISSRDVIYIPSAGKALILGDVRQPAGYDVQEGMDILDLIALAGGELDTADLQQVTLSRTQPDGKVVERIVNVQALLSSRTSDVPLIHPNDVVFVPSKQQVIVLGAVRAPGTYILGKGERLVDVIGAAGGVLVNADSRQISITRSTGDVQEVLEVDAYYSLSGRAGGENPVLVGGDVIFVPEAKNNVLVLGQVQRPGTYTLDETTGVLDVLAEAGGLTDRAASDRATLTRQSDSDVELIPVDIGQLQQGVKRDIILQPGDVVFVPEGAPQVLVLGQVRNPGSYRLTEQTRLLDVMAMAGGTLDSAGATLTLTRDGQISEADLGALTRLGVGNQRVHAGDVIYVPEGKNRVLILGEVRNPGYYSIGYGDRVLDGIGYAGGLLDSAAEDQVTVTRQTDAGPEIMNMDLVELMENRYLPDNVPLEGGDIILVPRANRNVLVLGEVARPGSYTMRPGQRMLDIVAMAGGFTDEADTENVALTRDEDGIVHTATINAEQLIDTGQGDVDLVGGELIVVPRSNKTVLVFGEVARPGAYTVRSGERIMDVVAKAGGPSNNADLTQASLTRTSDGSNGQSSTLDISQAFMDSSHSSNHPVHGGDMLYIPSGNRRVLVLGQVRSPGAFVIDPYTRLLDALALAGGPSGSADLTQATLTRTSGGQEEVVSIDLSEVLANEGDNYLLQGGDVLYVPEARQVLVMGEVNRPGSFTLPTGGRILDMLALAGGPKSNFQEQSVVMTRQEVEGERVWHMSYAELMANQAQNNLLLAGGDVLYIPEARRQVLVLGEVASPGVYNIPIDAKVLDAIALAGGPTKRAALESVGIYRGGAVDTPSTLTMGKDKLLFEGDANENPPITGGDVIYVPETTKPNWTEIFSFVGGLRTFQQLIEGIFN